MAEPLIDHAWCVISQLAKSVRRIL